MIRRILLVTIVSCIVCSPAFCQETVYQTFTNIRYYEDSVSAQDAYIAERCVLDIYYPIR